MEHLLGLLRVRVQRGVNLAIRDVTARTSDPYVVIKMGKQKLKTSVVKKSTNPEWNEDLTLSIADPTLPVNIHVYDKDTFTLDDKMGDAEFEIGPFLEALRVRVQGVPSGTVLSRVQPSRQNCLAEESCIIYTDGQVVQNMCIRLRNVERGNWNSSYSGLMFLVLGVCKFSCQISPLLWHYGRDLEYCNTTSSGLDEFLQWVPLLIGLKTEWF